MRSVGPLEGEGRQARVPFVWLVKAVDTCQELWEPVANMWREASASYPVRKNKQFAISQSFVCPHVQ